MFFLKQVPAFSGTSPSLSLIGKEWGRTPKLLAADHKPEARHFGHETAASCY
jgi:hypothetical protein